MTNNTRYVSRSQYQSEKQRSDNKLLEIHHTCLTEIYAIIKTSRPQDAEYNIWQIKKIIVDSASRISNDESCFGEYAEKFPTSSVSRRVCSKTSRDGGDGRDGRDVEAKRKKKSEFEGFIPASRPEEASSSYPNNRHLVGRVFNVEESQRLGLNGYSNSGLHFNNVQHGFQESPTDPG